MCKQRQRNTITIVLALLFLNIFGNAEVIAINLISGRNPSVVTASQIDSNANTKVVQTMTKKDIPQKFVNSPTNHSSNEKSSQLRTSSNILANNQPLSDVFTQFIIPVDQTWSSYGDLTLSILASDIFFKTKSQNTQINQKENNEKKGNIKENFTNHTNQTKNMASQQYFFSATPQDDSLSNSMLTHSQLSSLENHLNQIQKKVAKSISSQNEPVTANSQTLPLVPIKPAQSRLFTDQPSNLSGNFANSQAFSSNPLNNNPSNRDQHIQKLKDSVNARFNSFLRT